MHVVYNCMMSAYVQQLLHNMQAPAATRQLIQNSSVRPATQLKFDVAVNSVPVL